MNNSIKIGGAFVLGILGGVLASAKYFDQKYKKMADDEIQELDKYYTDKYKNTEKNEGKDKEMPKTVKKEIHKVPDIEISRVPNIEVTMDGPDDTPKKVSPGEQYYADGYEISNEEFDSSDDESICLTLHSDGIISDDGGFVVEELPLINIIKNTAESAGNINVFYIHYPKTGCNYEIAKSNDPYYF